MGRWKSEARRALLGAALALLLWTPGDRAQMRFYDDGNGPPLIEEEVRIFGPAWRYTIATKILRPQGAGPFGAIVLNHGVPLSAEARRRESPELMLDTAAILARSGYAVIMPLRSGFGATGGWFAEDAGSCADPDYRGGEAAAADDIMAAYDFARRLPYVGANGHYVFTDGAGARYWVPAVGRFLRAHGLAFTSKQAI